MKKLLSLVAFILVLAMCPITAFAEESKKDSDENKQTINLTINVESSDETKEEEQNEPKVRIRRSTSTYYLDSWECDIRKISSGYIKGSAESDAFTTVDEMGCTIHFQMYDGGRWTTIKSKSYKDYDTDSIRKVCNLIVTKGKSYRVVVDHYIIYNGHKETTTSTSSSLYVN